MIKILNFNRYNKNNNKFFDKSIFTRICYFYILIILLLNIKCTISQDLISKSKPGFEEYYMEHEVSQKDAKISFMELRNKLFNKTPSAWCPNCTAQIKKYCLGFHMIHDHCCCDQRHGEDDLSWVPHTCYVGNNRCRPYKGSCLKYTEIKDCCCDRFLAEELMSMYSHASSIIQRFNKIYYLVPFLIIFNFFINRN